MTRGGRAVKARVRGVAVLSWRALVRVAGSGAAILGGEGLLPQRTQSYAEVGSARCGCIVILTPLCVTLRSPR